MALRAGYYGLKRVIKDKLLNLANAAPSDISPDNPIASKGDVLATVDLMKDTTGWIGGNLLENVLVSQTVSNIDVTVNDNKIVNLNGTASENITTLFINTHINLKAGKYYLSGNPEGITGNQYGLRIADASYSINTFFEQGKVFKLAQDMTDLRVDIRVPSGTVCNNTLFKPIILTEEQYKLNPSYRPYHESVEDWYWSENAKTGVHNIFNPALFISGADANMATVNSDGSSIRVKADSAATFRLCAWYLNVTPNTDYTVKTSVAITSGKCAIKAETVGGTNIKTSDTLSADGVIEMTFNSGNNTQLKFDIFCTWDVSEVGDVTCNNLFIKETADTYNNFMPFAMTNRELTEKATVKSDSITSSFTANGDVANGLKKIGEIVFIDAAYKEVTASQWDVIATIPAGFRPKTPCRLLDGFGKKSLVININGDIQAAESISDTYVYIHSSWINQDSDPAPENREISAEPEVKETKKATKKKVIKEEE